MTTNRRRLPNRRPSVTQDIEVDGRTFTASVGFFADGTPGEIFIRAKGTEGGWQSARSFLFSSRRRSAWRRTRFLEGSTGPVRGGQS